MVVELWQRPSVYYLGISRLLLLVTGLPGTGKSTVAEAAADTLGTAVLAHDWAMSGLRPYPELQSALDGMEPPGHRTVGWSILRALAQAQLRSGRSIVLDGVARQPEVAQLRELVEQEGSGFATVLTTCSDTNLHRSRVEGRVRAIPNWYELDWAHVERARASWQPLQDIDLELDSVQPQAANIVTLTRFIGEVLDR